MAAVYWTVNGQNPEVLDAFAKSYAAEGRGEFEQAIEPLEGVYEASSYEMNLRLGWLHYLNADHVTSEKYYKLAVDLKPYAIEPKLGYVNPVSELGHWDVVLEYYKDILELDPQNSTVNYRIGLIYYYQDDFADSKRHFEKVVNLYPFDYYSLLMLGWTNLKMGSTNEAKVLFQKVLMYNPSDESAKEGLALLK